MSNQQTPEESTEHLDVLEAMSTLRAVRHLRRDPVDASVLQSLIFFASRAPSAGNRQPWRFVVLVDAEQRRRFGEIYDRASRRLFERLAEAATDEQTRRIYEDATFLSEHMGSAPAIIIVCSRATAERPLDVELPSIYPAVQNLLLAARAYGLGSTITIVHKRREDDVRALLGIPDGFETVCAIPVGYPEEPARAFRPVTARHPVEAILSWDTFA